MQRASDSVAGGDASVHALSIVAPEAETPSGIRRAEDLQLLLRAIPHKPGFFERHAVSFLRKRSRDNSKRRPIPTEENPIHILTAEERGAVNAIVKRTVTRCFLVGAASAAFCAGTFLALPFLGATSALARWGGVGIASAIATVFELWAIYFEHLDAVSSMLLVTGARVAPSHESAFEEEIAHALARASLDLPDPTRVFEEIDPRRETNKLALVAAVVLYKGKRSISNYLGKQVFLHLVPAGVLRTFAPFVSVPITGAWNALVSWRVLREARLRAIGPSAVQEITRRLLDCPREHDLSEACRASLLRAVGVAMVRKHAAHPNLLALLYGIAPSVGAIRAEGLDDPARFLEGLKALEGEERRLVVTVFQIASVLDGRIGRRLRKLLREARSVCGCSADVKRIVELRDLFMKGERIDPSTIEALGA